MGQVLSSHFVRQSKWKEWLHRMVRTLLTDSSYRAADETALWGQGEGQGVGQMALSCEVPHHSVTVSQTLVN